ncbi:MAG: HAMP domain-containing histidine kinase [Alphaproteobacteria bacterium]|nr:HAMP domain-containing histidine kinase [Alphaproteobacteria bacterium]
MLQRLRLPPPIPLKGVLDDEDGDVDAHADGRPRWGLLMTTLLLGLALIGICLLSFRAAQELSEVVDAGQAQGLHRAWDTAQARWTLPPSDADLAGFLEQETEYGLRYVGLVERDRVLSQAGTPVLPPTQRPRPLERVEGRIRIHIGPPSQDPPHTRGGPPPPGGLQNSHPLPVVIMEFEPLLSQDLRMQALLYLCFGLAAAAVLLVVAGVMWRRIQEADALAEVRAQQARLATLGQMSAVLAHEIRNPLASLKGNAQLLVERLDEASKERRIADRVVREAQRLEKLSHDLLDFVRSGEARRRDIDPTALLQEAADAVAPGRFTLRVDRAPATWPLDPERVLQVLVNLMDNAVKACPDDTAIDACAEQVGGVLELRVRDHGEGLPAGDEELVFEPFHTGRVKGVGLGLAICRRIVELHGGTITARNAPDGGAEFCARIPRG